MRIRGEAGGFLWAAWRSVTTSASGLLASQADSNRFLPLLAALALISLTILSACQRKAGAYDAFNHVDCLPAISLVDQHDHQISLSSLKGKPILVDFIYTSCPGPCLTLTQKMARVARKLAPQLGSSFTMVSITIDPEHDGPAQLAAYYACLRYVAQHFARFQLSRPSISSSSNRVKERHRV